MSYSYDRRTASEALSSNGFVKEFESHLSVGDRHVGFKQTSIPNGLGGSDTIYIYYYNLPKHISVNGAEGMNNRVLLKVEGFHKTDKDAPVPLGKVKAELLSTALPREFRMRAKSGSPEAIAKYVATYLNTIAAKVEPNFTHTPPEGRSKPTTASEHDNHVFDKGDRVMTPVGPGTVVYMRMDPSSPHMVDVYSVFLDHKKKEMEKPPFPSYSGTIFKAHQVKPL